MTPTITPPKNSTMTIRAILALIGVLGYVSYGHAQSYTIMPQPFGLVQDNSGHVVNGGCVWTYLAGTTTPAATYSDNAGTQNTNPIKADPAGRFTAFLVAGSSYKFVYENTPCTVSPPTHGAVLRTADNITAVPSSASNVDAIGLAGETISAGLCAYLSDGSGGKIQGQWYKCDSANTYSSSLAVAVGIAPAAIIGGSTGTIRVAGSVPGLSVSTGTTYYAGTAGALTSTPPANLRQLAIADSTGSIFLPIPGIPNAVATVARGGSGVGTLAAHGVLLGNGTGAITVSGTGTAGQVFTSNGASADGTFQSAGALALLHTGSGTDTTVGATNVDTYALASQLTDKDTLYISYTVRNTGANANLTTTIINSTDTVTLHTPQVVNNTWRTGQMWSRAVVGAPTKISTTGINDATTQTAVSFTTNFTGAWTVALHHAGVASGDSLVWSWSIYKIAGQ